MEKDTGKKIRLGVFVTVGIALFMLIIYYIGQRERVFGGTICITGVFKNVNGLKAGHSIRYTGIDIGTVKEIEIISDTSAKVQMKIDKSAKKFIKKDALAAIGSEGLMGNKVVNILPGSLASEEIEDDDVIRTVEGGNVEEIMSKMNNIAGDLEAIVSNIKEGKGAVGKLLMDSTLANDLGQTVANAKHATAGLSENMEAAKHNFLLKGYYKKKEKEKKEQLQNKK